MRFAAYHIGMVLLVGFLLVILVWQGPRARGLAGGFLLLLGLIGVAGALAVGRGTFPMARLVAYLVFLYVPLFLLGVAVICWRLAPTIAWGSVGLTVALLLVAVDAFLIEPRWLEVSRVSLRTPKLDHPLRIVLIADLQTDRPGEYETRALRTAMDQQPDLLLFAGDYVHRGVRSATYVDEIARLDEVLQRVGLHAPLGVVAVAGNVDEPGLWPKAFEGVEATTVEQTQSLTLGPVTVTALGLWDAYSTDLSIAPQEGFHIVMGHSPNFALGQVDADLLLAGHTHGGQVRLPFIGPLFTMTWVPRAWAAGVTTIAPGKTLVVSRGVGMERALAPRLRFLCRPELVVIDLLPE